MKTKSLAPIALIPFLVCLTVAQETKRIPNLARIVRNWNSLTPETEIWNVHMNAADKLLHERFNPKLLVADPDAKRKETVGHYKAAKESLLKQLDALNELIEEEDY